MRKNTHSFEPYLEIYRVIPTHKTLRYHRAHGQPSESFLKQWVQIIKAIFQQAAETSCKDYLGTLRSPTYTGTRVDGAAGVITTGIILGTGTNAVAIDDYKLQTPIAHGSGATQLNYKATTFDPFRVIGSVASFKIKRQFENLSGSTITVTEAGLYCYNAVGYYFDLVRDLLTTPFDILNTQIAEFRYTFKATV